MLLIVVQYLCQTLCLTWRCRCVCVFCMCFGTCLVSHQACCWSRRCSREKRELENDCDYVIPPALICAPFFIFALANYAFSHLCISACSPSASLPFHFVRQPLNSPALILIHFSSHSHPKLSHFHQIECHSYLPFRLLQPVKQIFRISAAIPTLQIATSQISPL